MTEYRDLICVTCPVGCELRVRLEDGELAEIEGNACKRGVAFAQEEVTAPKRVLCTTVQVAGGELPLAPVRSAEPLPKAKLLDVAAHLRQVVVPAPVAMHQVVSADVLGTGVDIIATRAIGSAQED